MPDTYWTMAQALCGSACGVGVVALGCKPLQLRVGLAIRSCETQETSQDHAQLPIFHRRSNKPCGDYCEASRGPARSCCCIVFASNVFFAAVPTSDQWLTTGDCRPRDSAQAATITADAALSRCARVAGIGSQMPVVSRQIVKRCCGDPASDVSPNCQVFTIVQHSAKRSSAYAALSLRGTTFLCNTVAIASYPQHSIAAEHVCLFALGAGDGL